MAGAMESWEERSRLRVSDEERHRVAELLREAAAEGRLDMDELEHRLAEAYAAKTYGDLVPVTADLPIAGTEPGHLRGPEYDRSLAVMSTTTRRGVWRPGAAYSAVAVMGGIELDLRQAELGPETVIRANAVMGGIDVYIDAHTRVVVDGLAVMGAFEHGRDKVTADVRADAPLVRVTGLALMGRVTVRRKGAGDGRRWMLER